MATGTPITTSRKVTITLPNINFNLLAKKVAEIARTIFSNIYNPINKEISHAGNSASSQAKRIKFSKFNSFNFNKFNKNKLKIILPVIIGIVVLAAIVNVVRALPDAQSRPVTSQNSTKDTLATVELNKKFDFPLKGDTGKEVGKFEYVIQSAQLQKQIIVQGQRMTVVSGRVFLVFNLKITNNQKQPIQLNTRDYIRLVTANNKNEQLAPDIHNDPVEVQAISTKYTRVGIAIDEKDAKNKIELKVGEIDGDKQTIDLNFKY